MAKVVVTLKVMPDSPDTDLENVGSKIKKEVHEFAKTNEIKIEQEPIAFGLKALIVIFVMPEEKGSTDALEEKIAKIKGVNSVECIDVRRAIG